MRQIRGRLASTFHSRAVPSLPAVARVLPSGLNATAATAPVWPVRTAAGVAGGRAAYRSRRPRTADPRGRHPHTADQPGGRPAGLRPERGVGSRRGGVHEPESLRVSRLFLVRRGQAQGFDPRHTPHAQHGTQVDGVQGTAHHQVQIHDGAGGTGALRAIDSDQSVLSLVTLTAAPRFGAAVLASSPARSRSPLSATTMLTADPVVGSRRRVAPTTGY